MTRLSPCILATSLVAWLATGCASPGPSGARQLENGSFQADLDGVTIHYEVHGQGPVLMTVPNSWGLSLEGLRAMYRPLEEHLTLVYFDPRGMGESAPIQVDSDMSLEAIRADFDALRRHLDLDRVHAIGWSNGAMNLIHLAEEKPETLSSAIFLHGTASYTEEDREAIRAQHPELVRQYEAFTTEMATAEMSLEERNRRLEEFNLQVIFPALFADPEAGRARLQVMYRDTSFSWDHARYSSAQTQTFDLRSRLPSIPVRSLVLAGAADMLPPQKVEETHLGLPDSTFVVFEHSGHFAPVEEPEAFVATVLDFLGVPAD